MRTAGADVPMSAAIFHALPTAAVEILLPAEIVMTAEAPAGTMPVQVNFASTTDVDGFTGPPS